MMKKLKIDFLVFLTSFIINLNNMNILSLNPDVWWYILLFLENPMAFLHSLPIKRDLFRYMDGYRFGRYLDYLVINKHSDEFKQMAKYVEFGKDWRVEFVIKNFDHSIFKFCLRNIKGLKYYRLFEMAFRYNNINAIKQLMKYEKGCVLKKFTHSRELYSRYYEKYQKSVRNGCCENGDILKYYISHSIHLDSFKLYCLNHIELCYRELVFCDEFLDITSESAVGVCHGIYIGQNFGHSSYNRFMNRFIMGTNYFIQNYFLYKDIFYIDTSRFKHLFKKYNTDDVLTDHYEKNYFYFDFTFDEYEMKCV